MIIKTKDKKDCQKQLYTYKYFNVRNAAWQFLIENKITCYPLDFHDIAKKNNWKIISYKQYSRLKNEPLSNIMKISSDGFTVINNKKQFTIVINEQNTEQRNRFTIAHEIGHIILHSHINPKQLEKEANMFASRILMPMCVLHECNLNSPIKIVNVCNVSKADAEERFKRYKEIITRNKIYLNKYENRLKKQLQNFFENFKKSNK